jgi:hypothetical protein
MTCSCKKTEKSRVYIFACVFVCVCILFARMMKHVFPHPYRMNNRTVVCIHVITFFLRYGKNMFYWDIPAPDVNINSELIDHVAALKTPKPHRHPGPVPKPPSIVLPPPPSLLGVNTESGVSSTASSNFPSRSEYLALVQRYNKEASQIFNDWQPHCPNFKYVAVKITKQQVWCL